MKYVIIIPDGCADEPQQEFSGKTPLQVAHTPAMDRIALEGLVGQASNVPAHLTPGSAVANMSLLGYDPEEHFTGRAPLEAAAQGIDLAPTDWAIRCNLVTIEKQIMRDFTADHISSDEAVELLNTAQNELRTGSVSMDRLEFKPGVSYRNLLIYRGSDNPSPFTEETTATPPHDLTDKSVADDFPCGPGSYLLTDIMGQTVDLFAKHPVNVERARQGKLPATNVWLWGLGRMPNLAPFVDVYGKTGAMITAVDLLRGLAVLIGWQRVEVDGATGYTDTDYAAKGRAAIETVPHVDVVCVHVEATDEASHEGDGPAKVKALEEIDRHIVGPVWQALRSQGEYRILVTPDHPTPLRTKTHSHGMVPFCSCGVGVSADSSTTYDELSAQRSSLAFDPGWRLMDFFLNE